MNQDDDHEVYTDLDQELYDLEYKLLLVRRVCEIREAYKKNPSDENQKKVGDHFGIMNIVRWRELLETGEFPQISDEQRQLIITMCDEYIESPSLGQYQDIKTSWLEFVIYRREDSNDISVDQDEIQRS